MTSEFTMAVVYSAAQIIHAHGCVVAAEDLLNTSVKPTDDLSGCAEFDLAILRAHIPSWKDVPPGV